MAIFDPKAKTIAGYQRMIEEKKRTIVKYYDQIGRLYYGQYKDMSVDVTKDINARCEAVSQLENEIKDCEHKILYEKGLKLCPNCGKENMLAYAFCFACGTKFAVDEPVTEVVAIEEATTATEASEVVTSEVTTDSEETVSSEVANDVASEATEENAATEVNTVTEETSTEETK